MGSRMAESWHFSQGLIGEILRRARMRIGLSIRELSARSGVSKSQILRVESGEFDVMLSTLLKLARHLGCPPGIILEQGAVPNPGFFVKLIGQAGIPELLQQVSTSAKSRNARTRIVILSAQCAVAASCLLQSSNPRWILDVIDFPVDGLRQKFREFTAEIERLDIEDRCDLQREIEAGPLELLTRFELITPAIAAQYLTDVEGHPRMQPDFFKIV